MDSMFAAAKLDEAQMAALGHCAGASLKQYGAGQTLIRVGERDFKFFVVRSGEIEIVDESGETPRTIAVLRRGEFTGDVAHLTGGPAPRPAPGRRPGGGDAKWAEGAGERRSPCPRLR